MGTIITLIVLSAIAAAIIGYYLTREEGTQKEESPLQKVLNKSMEKSAKDIKVKDAVEVKPRVTKVNASPELQQFIDKHSEELDKLQKEISNEITKEVVQKVEQTTPPAKKKSRHAYKK